MIAASHLAASHLAACSNDRRASLTPPPGVDLVAALAVSDGRISAGSALVSLESAAWTVEVAEDESRLFVGYRLSDLDHAGAISREAMFRAQLREPRTCEPSLPAPAWVSELSPGGSVAEAAPSSVPPVTADWLAGFCPHERRAALPLETSCACPAVPSVDGCRTRYRFDSATCLFSGTLELHTGPDGETCADGSGLSAHCLPRADPSLAALLECADPSCEIAAHAPVALPEVEIRKAGVGPVDLSSFPQVRRNTLAYDRIESGLISDLAVLSGTVAVVSYDAGGERVGHACVTRDAAGLAVYPSTQIHFLDPITLAERERTQGPTCLTRIARDPTRNGLIGIFRPERVERLGRFGARGELLEAIDLPMPVPPGSGGDPHLRAVDLVTDGSRAIAVVGVFDPGPPTFAVTIHDVDLGSFRVVTSTTVLGAIAWGAVIDRGRVWLADDRLIRLIGFDLATGDLTLPPVEHLDSFQRLGYGLVLPGQGKLAITNVQRPPGLEIFEEDGRHVMSRRYFEAFGAPTALTLSPATPGLAWVALFTQTAEDAVWTSELALFDVERARFRPGRIGVGFGPLTRLVSDGGKNLYGLLRWTGQIVRIEISP